MSTEREGCGILRLKWLWNVIGICNKQRYGRYVLNQNPRTALLVVCRACYSHISGDAIL